MLHSAPDRLADYRRRLLGVLGCVGEELLGNLA